jgi:hypothetical protein
MLADRKRSKTDGKKGLTGHSQKNDEVKIITDWLDLKGEKTIRTHQQVDADAAFSAALMMEFQRGAKLQFKQASWTTDRPNTLAVDMLNGKNAVKGLKQGSAFGLLVEVLGTRDARYKTCFKDWADQLNLTDSGKTCHDRVVLPELIRAWKTVGLDDKTTVNRARELVRGKLIHQKMREKRQETSRDIPIYSNVAIAVDTYVDKMTLFKRGAKAIVQRNECGIAIHLNRKVMQKGHNLTELENILPKDWFIHPQGFLASFGGPKATRDPSKSGISIEALLILVQNWIREVA